MLRRWAIAIALPWLFAFYFSPAVAADDEWILDQLKPDYGGHTVFVSPQAIKIISKNYGFHLLCRAPDWKVWLFRPSEKVFWACELKDFSSIIMFNPVGVTHEKVAKFEFDGKETLLGVKCSKYVETTNHSTKVLVADDIKTTPEAAELSSRFFTIPRQKSLPMQYSNVVRANPGKASSWFNPDTFRDGRTGVVFRVRTLSAKKVPFNAADFAYPVGYRRVKDIKDVSFSKNQKEDLKKMIDDIGFVSEPGSSKSGRDGNDAGKPIQSQQPKVSK